MSPVLFWAEAVTLKAVTNLWRKDGLAKEDFVFVYLLLCLRDILRYYLHYI